MATVVLGVDVSVGEVDLSNLVTGLPELGRGEAERLDATTLNDSTRKYVNGIKDLGDSLAIECLYSLTEYQALLALEVANNDNNAITIKFTQDNLAFEFTASVTVTYGASEVNGLKRMTINLTPSSDVTIAVKSDDALKIATKIQK